MNETKDDPSLDDMPETTENPHLRINDQRRGDGWVYTSLGKQSCVLDLGCGFGALSFQYAAVALRVIACDRNPQCLEFINIHKKQEGANNLQTVLLEGNRLPFEDEGLDLIFLNQGFERLRGLGAGKPSWPDTKHWLDELFRILKPQGELCLTVRNRIWQPWNISAHTLGGISGLLQAAGFTIDRLLSLLPDPDHPLYILDAANPDASAYLVDSLSQRLISEISWGRRLFMALIKTLSRLGIHRLHGAGHLYPAYLIIVRKKGKDDVS